jgi:hypothetical protein
MARFIVLDLFRTVGHRQAWPTPIRSSGLLTPPTLMMLSHSPRLQRSQAGHQADEYMAKIAAERIVRHLELARFVVMRRAPIGGSAPTRA